MTSELDIIAATVQQLLTQTTALLWRNGSVVVRDEILDDLEQDIGLVVKQLRRVRNESLPIPINRLPPELLQMVFAHLRPPPPFRRVEHYSPRPGFASYKPLVAAMLVCHKWHAIASHAASLWTEIDFQRQRTYAPVLLARSLGADIHLYGHITGEENTLEVAIRNHGTRIRKLEIRAGESVSALQSILAINMPRLRVLCLSSQRNVRGSTTLISALGLFPALKAMLLDSFLFLPAYVLPQLTHLRLAGIGPVNASDVLNFLRSTPSLEVLDISISLHPSTVSLPVALPRLQSLRICPEKSAAISYIVNALKVPRLPFLDLHLSEATALSTPFLLDHVLTSRKMPHLAMDVGPGFSEFDVMLHGCNVSLSMTLRAVQFRVPDRTNWAFTGLPTVLPLSGVEEFHIVTAQPEHDTPSDFLTNLATYMPAVSTLLIKYDPISGEEDVDGHMELARTVSTVLESDNPVRFPHLAHLELIVGTIPLEFCEVIAHALARRHEDGRGLRTLRIYIGDHQYSSEWKQKWQGRQEPDFKETGIFDHVDAGDISGDSLDRNTDSQRLGWAWWKDSVPHSRHEYWRD